MTPPPTLVRVVDGELRRGAGDAGDDAAPSSPSKSTPVTTIDVPTSAAVNGNRPRAGSPAWGADAADSRVGDERRGGAEGSRPRVPHLATAVAKADAEAAWADGNEVVRGIVTWRVIGTWSVARSGRCRAAERLSHEIDNSRRDGDRGETVDRGGGRPVPRCRQDCGTRDPQLRVAGASPRSAVVTRSSAPPACLPHATRKRRRSRSPR